MANFKITQKEKVFVKAYLVFIEKYDMNDIYKIADKLIDIMNVKYSGHKESLTAFVQSEIKKVTI